MPRFIRNIGARIASGGSAIKSKSASFISAFGYGGLGIGFEDFYDTSNLHSFRNSLYLFVGVSMIRESVSSIPLQLFRIKNEDGDTEEIYDDPFLDTLENPNVQQTQKEFWKLSVSYYLLSGEAFWASVDEPGVPEQVFTLRPDYVEIVMSQDGKQILAYEYRPGYGDVLKFKPENVLHFKNPDPVNPLRGIGVVRPARIRILTEQEASKYQSQTFYTQGMPNIAVMTDVDPLTSEASEEAREAWTKIYGKGEAAAGFFGGSVKDIKVLSAKPSEMAHIGTQNFVRDEIALSLRIPKGMMTSDDVNLANSKTARVNYYMEAVLPVLDSFIDVLNNRKLGAQMNEDKFLDYDNPVKEDRDILLKEATELKDKGIITVNEARDLMHYGEIEGGDELSTTPSGAGAFGSVQEHFRRERLRQKALRIMKKRKVLYRRFKATTAIANELRAKQLNTVKRQRNSVFRTKEQRDGYVKNYNDRTDKKAEDFLDTLNVYNEGLASRIVKFLKETGLTASGFIDVVQEIPTAKNIFVPLMKEMYRRIGQDTLNIAANGFQEKNAEQFYTTEEVLRALELRAEFFISSMLDTDYEELKTIISAGMEQGKGVDEIGRMIRKYFDDMSVARAKTIARTETGRLMSQATEEAFKQSDIITGKEWLSAGDSKVRPAHQTNAAQGPIPVEEAFSNGEHYPGESTINCRCAIAPAV